MNSANVALVALVAVVADLDSGRIAASNNDHEILNHAMEVLAQLGEENER